MEFKRLTLLAGHYGSGKTFVAVNYALALSDLKKNVSIYDLDIVNPYFRTVDAENLLSSRGV
jgi:Mrp family chromosome partitioning ATPase